MQVDSHIGRWLCFGR